MPYLAVSDKGDEVISNSTDYWGPWEPAGAGAVVRRSILKRYIEQMTTISISGRIGCKGTKEILRGEDSLMMRGAYQLGLDCSYQPRLSLKHHINPERIKFFYLLRLLYGYGRSLVILERALGKTLTPVSFKEVPQKIRENMKARTTHSFLETLCMFAWECGYFYELNRQD